MILTMPVWDRYIAIEGMVISGMEFPQDYIEIDKNMIIKKAKEGSCAVHLRIETEEGEELRTSRNAQNADERVLNFASLYALFSDRSVNIRSAGVATIGKCEQLGDFKGLVVGVRAKYPPDVKTKRTEEERKIITDYIEYFKDHERTLINTPYLRNALHYFYYATRTQRVEDRLISLMISLESLFSREIQELSYRLGLRAASLICYMFEGKTPSDIFMDIRELYKKRNFVVHGREEVEVTHGDIQRLRDYIRKAIRAFLFLAQTMKKDDVLDLLDSSLVDEEKRTQVRSTVKSVLSK